MRKDLLNTLLQIAYSLLARYGQEGEEFLDSIVTTYETYFTPEIKPASMESYHVIANTEKRNNDALCWQIF